MLLLTALTGLSPYRATAQTTAPRSLLGTYLCGSQPDDGWAMAVNAYGYFYLADDTFSSTFSSVDFKGTDGRDVLLLKLTPDGKQMLAGAASDLSLDSKVSLLLWYPWRR